MSCSDYNNCSECSGEPERGTECPSSKSGYHCWHYPQTAYANNGYTLTTSAVTYSTSSDQQCCFCGVKESQLHGPYHPLNTSKWTHNVTGQTPWYATTTVPVPLVGGTSTATVTFTTGSGYFIPTINNPSTVWCNPQTAGYSTTAPATSGYITLTGNGCSNSPGSASLNSCPVGCVGGIGCKRAFSNIASTEKCVNGCNGTTTGCTLCPKL